MNIINPFLLFSLFLFVGKCADAQQSGSSKVIVTNVDTLQLSNKIRNLLATYDFVVRDDGRTDTMTTHLRELRTMQGYCRIQVVIRYDSIIFSGVYGTKRVNDWGYTTPPKIYKTITYFKGSKTWPLLLKVASSFGGDVAFSK